MSKRPTKQEFFFHLYLQLIPVLALVLALVMVNAAHALPWLAPSPDVVSVDQGAAALDSQTLNAAAEPQGLGLEDVLPSLAVGALETPVVHAQRYSGSPDDEMRINLALGQRRALLEVPGVSPTITPEESETPIDASGAARLTTALLDPVGHVWQTLNNCGPASVSMVLAYFGHAVSQTEAQAVLRPDPEEWGMLPNVVPPYVADFGLDARVLDHGTRDDIKTLLSHNVPVIVLQWLTEEEPIPHYRVVVGYDDKDEVFIVNDGVLGFGKRIAYADFESLWDVYANLYLPIFPQTDTPQVQAMLGPQWERTVTFVALAKSRPAWDALLRAGGPGATAALAEEPTPEEMEASAEVKAGMIEATATPEPNTRAETAWALVQGKAQTGALIGSNAGAFAFYTVKVEQAGVTLEFKYLPDDAVIASGVGVKVYNTQGKVVSEGVNRTGQVGERSVLVPETPGVYLVQVYNYLPNLKIEFSLLEKESGGN